MIDDRDLSMLLRSFYLWHEAHTGGGTVEGSSPKEVFQRVLRDDKKLTIRVDDFDGIFLDLAMYNDENLLQSTLEILMTIHSSKSQLLTNARRVQLLTTSYRERQFKLIRKMLLQLERNAETQELWGGLENAGDLAIKKQTLDILLELTVVSRRERKVLCFHQKYEPDEGIQDVMRNLGFVKVSDKIFDLLETIQGADEALESVICVKEICRATNELMFWFTECNEKNQELVFDKLEFFLDTLDSDIGSHNVIPAIFRDNEALMRRCPIELVRDMMDKICKNGRYHDYLMLLASITHAGEKNIQENQFEIVKYITNPARIGLIISYFCGPDDSSYVEMVQLMEPALVQKDVTLDELDGRVAYHLSLLDVLSGCTVGRLNITTVEAKIQALFDFRDIIAAILDTRTLLLAKIYLGMHFFNAVLEVEMVIPGLPYSAAVWSLLQTAPAALQAGLEMLQALDDGFNWDHGAVDRQVIEYSIVMVQCVQGFFGRYFDGPNFNPSLGRSNTNTGGSSDRTRISDEDVTALIVEIFARLLDFHKLDSPYLSNTHKQFIRQALQDMGRNADARLGLLSLQVPTQGDKIATASKVDTEDDAGTDEISIRASYDSFLDALDAEEELSHAFGKDNEAFIESVEKLPSIYNTTSKSDIRYEPFLKRLVTHIRGRLHRKPDEIRMDARCTRTSTWLIVTFRCMIEKVWGMTIDERDDDGGEAEDKAAEAIVAAFNLSGITTLCIDLIAVGIDINLRLEAMKLCVALLFKEGGALSVQKTIYNHLINTDSDLFFEQLRRSIVELEMWQTWRIIDPNTIDTDDDLPDGLIVLRFMQLMCEGHYLPNQDILREQPNTSNSINLIDNLVDYIRTLSRIPCWTSNQAALRALATVLEVIQGPCEGNQEHFALNTELIETLNRLLRTKAVQDCTEEDQVALKRVTIDIFQGLLEGQGGRVQVYERVLAVIHLDIIMILCSPPEQAELGEEDNESDAKASDASTSEEDDDAEEEAIILRTECLVLLQMLCDFKPSLREELDMGKRMGAMLGHGVASVEVMWRGELQRRFFHVPTVCGHLAKSSKDGLVQEVDRTNLESKLSDFVYRAFDLYREIKHQEYLCDIGVDKIFSRSNQDGATWVAFTLACLINVLFLCFYTHDESGEASMPADVKSSLVTLNVINIICASFTLLLFLIVRVPVRKGFYLAQGNAELYSWLYALTDAMTVYYFVYLVIAFFGLFQDNLLPFLLLDIVVKNSTAGDVINAVFYPRKQLGVTLLLGLFVTYIFSFFIFTQFHADFEDDAEGDCDTLAQCLLTTVGYGLRLQGGIGDIMTHTLGRRWWLDVVFFFVVLIILLNVIFGIIIDTFGDLRSKKAAKVFDTENFCFICGIEKQQFDRAADGLEGFREHCREDHWMWNYLYFIIYIWEQDKDDDDGLEQYVRRCIQGDDLSWFPMNKAIRLTSNNEEEDNLKDDITDELAKVEKRMASRLSNFQSQVTVALEQLAKSNAAVRSTGGAVPSAFARRASMSRTATSLEAQPSTLDHQPFAGRAASPAPATAGRDHEPPLLEDDGQLYVKLEEIEGLPGTEEELKMVTCRIISEGGIFSIAAQALSDNGGVVLDNKRVAVLRTTGKDLAQTMKVQILSGGEGNMARFLGIIDVSYEEMVESNDLILTKEFTVGDRSCKFHLTSTLEQKDQAAIANF
jgi:hypothetical protein